VEYYKDTGQASRAKAQVDMLLQLFPVDSLRFALAGVPLLVDPSAPPPSPPAPSPDKKKNGSVQMPFVPRPPTPPAPIPVPTAP